MDFKSFCRIHHEYYSKYLGALSSAIARGEMVLGSGRLLYPTVVLYTDAGDHFLAELFGAAPEFKKLKVKQHKQHSALDYLYQFAQPQEGLAVVSMASRANGLINLLLARDLPDVSAVKARFKLDLPWDVRMLSPKGTGSVLSFQPTFQSCFLDNCLFINRYEQVYRLKWICNLWIVRQYFPEGFLRDDLSWRLNLRSAKSTTELSGSILSQTLIVRNTS